MKFGVFLLLIVGAESVANAQQPLLDPGIVLLRVGSNGVDSPRTAPGALTNFYFSGIPRLAEVEYRADGPALPTRLAGIEVHLFSRSFPLQSGPVTERLVHLQSIRQSPRCQEDQSQCLLTVVTAHFPFVAPDAIFLDPGVSYSINVTGPTFRSIQFRVSVTLAVPRIVRECDRAGSTEGFSGEICALSPFPLRYENGELVGSTARVVRPGDLLSMYAFGLGAVRGANRQEIEGLPAPAPLATAIEYALYAEYRPNAVPVRTALIAPFQQIPAFSHASVVSPSYVGLVPGQVGLYQINFRVPDPPPGTPSCPDGRLQSNLVLTLFSTQEGAPVSTDGATACVALR